MGQYFYGVMENGDGTVTAYHPANQGLLKLREHSWWYNRYVNWFCHELFCAVHRVAWVGDYADNVNCPKELYEAAWGDNDDPIFIADDPEFTLKHLYLCNYSKGEYLDCQKYYDAMNARNNPENDGRVIHPLSLLTATGNGQGGGDYRGVNEDKVGMWAWDLLNVTMFRPKSLKEIELEFHQ